MRNLAGVDEAQEVVPTELKAAGFNVIESKAQIRGEVPTNYSGVLTVGPYTLTAERRWVYYSVDCEPPLPLSLATRLDGTPFKHQPGHYSGGGSILGDVVRAEGYSRGMQPTRDVGGWHIDTEEGLKTFVRVLKEIVK